jgi:hypothetical protein
MVNHNIVVAGLPVFPPQMQINDLKFGTNLKMDLPAVAAGSPPETAGGLLVGARFDGHA